MTESEQQSTGDSAQATPQPDRISFGHGALSLLLPGAGQVASRRWGRGIGILAALAVLVFTSIWAIAQRARFPDLALSARVFWPLLVQSAALLVFLTALRYLLGRYAIKDAAARSVLPAVFGVLYIVTVFWAADAMLSLAGTADERKQVFELTGVLAAAGLAAVWLWQVADAARIGGGQSDISIAPGLLFACIVIFILGWNITGIDLPKAVREYQDTRIILRRIVWPWRSAFEFETIAIESTARIQAPCPPGAEGPPENEAVRGEAYIIVTPTCGDLSSRDLATGSLTLGTELTLTGGGFSPGAVVDVLWKNPIGNPFQPRGVGETSIEIGPDGTFESTLNIPEVVIPSTAVGDQVHTLIVRQESGEVFTGNLSREMNLALVGMLETIMIGLMATFFGILLAIPLSFLAARNLMAPIVTSLSSVVGGLLLALPGIVLAGISTIRISAGFGGLEKAPLQTAGVLFVLVLGFGLAGWRIGSYLFGTVTERVPPTAGRAITALGIALLGAGLGYLLGLGFSRGVVSIPQGADVAVISEQRDAIIGAVLIGLLAAVYAFRSGAQSDLAIGSIVYGIVRTLMNIVRSIEPLIWALVGIIWIGPGTFAGTIALTLHTVAALGKLYSEAVESIDPGPIEALQATGATRLQTIMYAVVPQVLPPFISFTIYRWDINVRLSTIIGLVGGGGIGFILIQWIRQFQYEPAGIAVWLITITVAALDFVSSEIRKRFV
ncbi:MAG: PhnE/PtxC family ABC transporter permease [Anaerolineales bacterium]